MDMSSLPEDEPAQDPIAPEAVLATDGETRSLAHDDWAQRGIYGFNSRDRRSRPFNLLRSQVMKAVRGGDWRMIGITSPTPRVGKSFMAANLAASLSRIPEMRTLLLDLDLRRGSIAEMFDIAPGIGINTFLSGGVDALGAAAHEIADTRLTIFPSFPTEESSAEMLAGSRMQTLVQAMRSLPDDVICVCDLPPAFANDDAAIVLREIDAYILVVEEGRTTAHQVRDAIELLKPAPCMGTVLNRYRGGIGGDDYGFGYGTQRGYDAYYQ